MTNRYEQIASSHNKNLYPINTIETLLLGVFYVINYITKSPQSLKRDILNLDIIFFLKHRNDIQIYQRIPLLK